MSSTPRAIIFVVVVTLAVLSLIGVGSLALTLFYKNYADPAVLTAFISITSGCIGALSALLVNTRQPVADSTSTVTAPPSTTTTEPQLTEIKP